MTRNPAFRSLLMLITLARISGCSGTSTSESTKTDWGLVRFFATGHWFLKEDVDKIKSGVVEGGYHWMFDWYGFETTYDGNGNATFNANLADIGGVLQPCETGWCYEGEPMLRFEVASGDTLAFFERDPEQTGAAFQRLVPPDLSINSNPDWMYRKYYFASAYSCEYPRIDSTFKLSLDENGKVIGSEKYERYEFHNQHNRPLVVFFDKDRPFHFAFTTYAGLTNGFSLHEVLNQEELLDGEGETVKIGEYMYTFTGVKSNTE